GGWVGTGGTCTNPAPPYFVDPPSNGVTNSTPPVRGDPGGTPGAPGGPPVGGWPTNWNGNTYTNGVTVGDISTLAGLMEQIGGTAHADMLLSIGELTNIAIIVTSNGFMQATWQTQMLIFETNGLIAATNELVALTNLAGAMTNVAGAIT